jgi:hypothetical protein
VPETNRRRDAALTVGFCTLVVAVAPLPPSPAAVLVGASATLLVEWLLSRRKTAVRRAWRRRWVRVTTFVGGLLAAALLAAAVGPAVWTAVLAGGITYLFVLAAATLRERR